MNTPILTFPPEGYLHFPKTIPLQDVQEMLDAIWNFMEETRNLKRDDPTTWKVIAPRGFQKLTKSGVFNKLQNQSVCEVIDQLLGPGHWKKERVWGNPLITFPMNKEWDVPHQSWHLDFMAPSNVNALPGIKMFFFLNSVKVQGGGTAVVAGSHLLIQDYIKHNNSDGHSADLRKALRKQEPWLNDLCSLNESENRINKFMLEGENKGHYKLKVVELTGEPGDMIVMHPWLFHVATTNALKEPRMMITQGVFREKAKIPGFKP